MLDSEHGGQGSKQPDAGGSKRDGEMSQGGHSVTNQINRKERKNGRMTDGGIIEKKLGCGFAR